MPKSTTKTVKSAKTSPKTQKEKSDFLIFLIKDLSFLNESE